MDLVTQSDDDDIVAYPDVPCGVCGGRLVQGELVILPCDHVLHASCAQAQLSCRHRASRVCPVCRVAPTKARRDKRVRDLIARRAVRLERGGGGVCGSEWRRRFRALCTWKARMRVRYWNTPEDRHRIAYLAGIAAVVLFYLVAVWLSSSRGTRIAPDRIMVVDAADVYDHVSSLSFSVRQDYNGDDAKRKPWVDDISPSSGTGDRH